MNREDAEFSPVENCGGIIEFHIEVENGVKRYSMEYLTNSIYPAGLYGVYAFVSQGRPVSAFTMGGVGSAWDPPIPDDCIPVFMLSDREGMFGRTCPACSGYFRQKGMIVSSVAYCPYCGVPDAPHMFLTESHLRYIKRYVEIFANAYKNCVNVKIDMRKCANTESTETINEHAYSEERQQTRIECCKCECVIDIIGQYGCCPSCKKRNTIDVLLAALAQLEERVDNPRYDESLRQQRENEWRDITKQCVSVFEGFFRDLIASLTVIPMTPSRRKSVEELPLHNPRGLAVKINDYFGIDIFHGVCVEDQNFVSMRFLRRHVYEHNSGIADDEYVQKSKDNVRVGQLLKERSSHVKRLIGLVRKLAINFDVGVASIA